MNEAEARRLIKNQGIEGWCPEAQGASLFQLASDLEPESVVVELGSYKGLSTAWMGLALERGAKARLVSVDLHDSNYTRKKGGSEATLADNMTDLDIKVDMIVGDTVQVADNASLYGIYPQSVSLLYIDACHAYESVKADFLAWLPMLAFGARVVFDDYTEHHPGVVRFVNEAVSDCMIEPGLKVGHAYFTRLQCHT